jgi:CPA1 family monovalent cation:H+ antiporter
VLVGVLAGHREMSAAHVMLDFLVSFIGGGLVGYAMGRLACTLFAVLRGFPTAEITLTLTLAYLTFFICDHYLHVSGVVATVIAGLVVGSTGRTRMAPTTFEHLTSAWEQFGFWANSLIFLFAAMLIPRLMADATLTDVALLLVLFVATLGARAVAVFGLLPLLRLTGLGTRVNRAYKTVMLWGGLRGAVSLALALAVTERDDVPYEARQFIAVATTGFVLMTLFINGISLRPLIRMLRLNELSQREATIRDQALAVALGDLQEKTDEVATAEHIGPEVRERIHSVFVRTLLQLRDAEVRHMSVAERVDIGLATLARREEEMFFDILKAQIVDWRMAEALLARAERLEDAVRAGGLAGFENAIAADVRYSRAFRAALRVHYLFGFQRWLASELGRRFAALMSKRSVAQRLILFAAQQLKPMLGEEATQRVVAAHQRRLDAVENALQALNLQYPSYALWLQESYLGRVARQLERMRYRDMLDQFLISGEVYADLTRQLEDRWQHIDHHPPLDIELGAAELIKRVPLFENLSADSLRAISRLLRPRLALPDQPVLKDRAGEEMCFVASGAVAVHLPDHTTVELGSGEFFGELALLGEQTLVPDVTSLGYSKLLMMSARDFRALLAHDADLRERIEQVARQRLRAIEVWKQFSAAPPAAS